MAENLRDEPLVEEVQEERETEETVSEDAAPEEVTETEAPATDVSEETEESDASAATEESAPEAEESDETPAAAGGDRFAQAQGRVAAARERVLGAEEEVETHIRNIREDLEAFETYEKEKLAPIVAESRRLLETIGMEEPEIDTTLEEVELEDPEEEKLRIGDLSSGKGGAFFLGLIAALATAGGWYLYAAQKAGASLIPEKMPDVAALSALAGKVSLLIGPAENPSVGAAVVIGSALVVWWLVYAVLVSMRSSRNQRLAEEIEEQAGMYCRKKEECKSTLEQVREHLGVLGQTVRKYEVLLDEKNAGLRRALFIEEAENFDALHERSRQMAEEIDAMLRELDALLSTPVARAGVLTPEGVEALRQAKRAVNDRILHLYN